MWMNLEVGNIERLIKPKRLMLISIGSCPEFGVSGSGIVREWRRRQENGPAIDSYDYYENSYDQEEDPQYQHSFVGPLSMSKGCDLTMDFQQEKKDTKIKEFVYRGNILVNRWEIFFWGGTHPKKF